MESVMSRHYNPAKQCFDDTEAKYLENYKPLYCRLCGSEDVRWRQQGGKWVLFSLEPGKLHVCPVADDFGVVK